MTASELSEHAGYLGDRVKMAAYRAALRAVMPANATVVDLGAGTGILGLLAAQEGAARIYAVDSGSIIGPAADVAAATPYADRFVHLEQRSTDVVLDEPADVVACDQIGGFVYDAGVLQYFADARRRLLSPGGVCVPAGFRLFVAPVQCDEVHDQIALWDSQPEGVDFTAMRDLAINTEHPVAADDVRLLGPAVEVAAISSDNDSPFGATVSLTIDQPGRLDGLVGWFEADLGGGITVTNDPTDPGRMQRWVNVYPLPLDFPPTVVGEQLGVTIDVRPTSYACTWTVAHEGRPAYRPQTLSTVLGAFISPRSLQPRSSPAT